MYYLKIANGTERRWLFFSIFKNLNYVLSADFCSCWFFVLSYHICGGLNLEVHWMARNKPQLVNLMLRVLTINTAQCWVWLAVPATTINLIVHSSQLWLGTCGSFSHHLYTFITVQMMILKYWIHSILWGAEHSISLFSTVLQNIN